MPGYQNGQAKLIRSNQQVEVIVPTDGIITAGVSSAAVQLERISHSSYPWGVSVQVIFSATPGTFEIDVQTSDTDVDGTYVSQSATITTVNAGFVGRVELVNFWAKFLRVNFKTFPNSVTATVLVTR
jgi:hypothetical protein